MAQFELCTPSKDKQYLQIRVLEIIEPVKCVVPNYNGFVHSPTVGKLISFGLHGKILPRKIYLSGDTETARCLRLLLPDPLDNVSSFNIMRS